MTPDWAAKPTTVPYAKFGDPQSLNLYGYVENEPVNRIDPDGHCCDVMDLSNFVMEHPQVVPAVTAALTRTAATVAAVASRVATTAVAVPIVVAGYLFSPGTGGGEHEIELQNSPPPSAPVTGVKGGIPGSQQATGPAVTEPIQSRTGSGPKAADAPGVSASGQATDKYGNKLGGSGLPQRHDTFSNTKEGARNQALNEGSGAVDHGDHYHAADNSGNKKPASTHHRHPKP